MPQLANHRHLPVQHGSHRILMAMKCGYTSLEHMSAVRKLRAEVMTSGSPLLAA